MADHVGTMPAEERDASRGNFTDYVATSGVLDHLAFERALRAADQSEERLERVLPRLGLLSETSTADLVARFLRVDRHSVGMNWEEEPTHDPLPSSFVKISRLLPLVQQHGSWRVLVDQVPEAQAQAAASYALEMPLTFCVATTSEWDVEYRRRYETLESAKGADATAAALDDDDIDVDRLRDMASVGPVVILVNQMLAAAVHAGASDIHIEPSVDHLSVRCRIDGMLREERTVSNSLKAAVVSRIKIMARLDIAERRLPQDGRLRTAVRGVDIDFRVSTLPTAHGESLVLRILDRSRVVLNLDTLGFTAKDIGTIRRLVHAPNGIVLVTGPTGSGKTTTLYAALHELDAKSLKIITVEDPIEQQIEGVSQVQVHPQIGLDFPNALRAIVRQDLNVLMIGEIRDLESAKIAIQASLIGRLVFATLHTNSAIGAIARLSDIGVEDYLLASSLRGVLAQRLVRKLCACAELDPEAERWRASFKVADGALFRRPKGCVACSGTGYQGRTVISELLVLDDRMRRLIAAKAPEQELQELAGVIGMRSLGANGIELAATGMTSVSEVMAIVEQA
jgi:general secretion pathway protein E